MAKPRSIRQIAASVGRAPSTISREIPRHGGRCAYRAAVADARAWERARRPQPCRLATSPARQRLVASTRQGDWSPEHIAGWLKRECPDQGMMRVSHDTMDRSVYLQARGVLKKAWLSQLQSRRRRRRSFHANTEGQPRGQMIDGVSIRDRPAAVDDRAIPGHWEGDVLAGSQHSHIATLVERRARVTMLVKVPGNETARVVTALSQHVRTLPAALRRSLTWDRGMELAQHKQFTLATKVQVYCCNPHSPWQRGTHEQTNRLLRQYVPKGTDLSQHSPADVNRIA